MRRASLDIRDQQGCGPCAGVDVPSSDDAPLSAVEFGPLHEVITDEAWYDKDGRRVREQTTHAHFRSYAVRGSDGRFLDGGMCDY